MNKKMNENVVVDKKVAKMLEKINAMTMEERVDFAKKVEARKLVLQAELNAAEGNYNMLENSGNRNYFDNELFEQGLFSSIGIATGIVACALISILCPDAGVTPALISGVVAGGLTAGTLGMINMRKDITAPISKGIHAYRMYKAGKKVNKLRKDLDAENYLQNTMVDDGFELADDYEMMM